MGITIKYVQYKDSKQNVGYHKTAVSVNVLTSVQKHTLVRSKATEGVFTRYSCSFKRVKPSNRDDEDADDTD